MARFQVTPPQSVDSLDMHGLDVARSRGVVTLGNYWHSGLDVPLTANKPVTIGTLPEGWRPPFDVSSRSMVNGHSQLLLVYEGGDVRVMSDVSIAAETPIELSTITYPCV